MRKIILAVFVSMVLVPSIATLALSQNKGGAEGASGPSGCGCSGGDAHDSHDTPDSEGGGNPTNHDGLIREQT